MRHHIYSVCVCVCVILPPENPAPKGTGFSGGEDIKRQNFYRESIKYKLWKVSKIFTEPKKLQI
jgi:hypothetical protein